MKKKILPWQTAGFIFVCVFGSLLHFVYRWANGNAVVGLFSSVNESTWEHMKLLFVTMFVFALIQSFFFKEHKNFWCIKLAGTILGLVLIPVLFNTLTGIFGQTPDWVNITLFYVSAAVAYIFEIRLFREDCVNCKNQWICFLALCIIAILFAVFTFATPEIPLFKDPITGTYGVSA